jgi:hypothetical protein
MRTVKLLSEGKSILSRTFVIILVILATVVFAEDRFREPGSHPQMSIKIVMMPKNPSRPLQVLFELSAEGKSAVAVSQQQFSVHIGNDEQPRAFVGNAVFPTNAPKVFTVLAKTLLSLNATTFSNRLAGGLWSDLRPGTYKLRVCIDAAKTREFDYQWLGETFSDDYTLVIKKD